MLTVLLLASLWACGQARLPPPLPYPLFPPHLVPPTTAEPPHKRFPGSVCPPDSTCVAPDDCLVQCLLPWASVGRDSCYLAELSLQTHEEATDLCSSHDAHLPVLETPEEMTIGSTLRLAVMWTDGVWDQERKQWMWRASNEAVDFARLGVKPPTRSEENANCLALVEGAQLLAFPCDQSLSPICETGSSSVSQCMRQKGRLCCDVDAHAFPEPCYTDDEGTRCFQRLREGYQPFGGGLIRPVLRGGEISYQQASSDCLKDGAELLVPDSAEMEGDIRKMVNFSLAFTGSQKPWLIGLRSDASGTFFYPNGTKLSDDSYSNWNSAGPGGAGVKCVALAYKDKWAVYNEDKCSALRGVGYICHIREIRTRLQQPEPVAPSCGRRQQRGVLGKSLLLPPPPPFLPPLGPHDDGRRGAAQFGEFPWQAAVWKRSSKADHVFSCSGALVHPAWVLTAAHCVSGVDAEDLKVTVGEWNLDETEPANLSPIPLEVVRVEISPDRVSPGPFGPSLEAGRLALLRISPDLAGADFPHVAPVCLPDPSLLQRLRHLRCMVTGWRGGAAPPSRHYPGAPEPDPRDVLRKFETSANRDDQCQQLGHRLKIVPQRPPPFQSFPHYPAYPPFGPYPTYLAQGRSGLDPEARDFGLDARLGFFPPLPPQKRHQSDVFVCPRDLRCIPDEGALLACAVPPPPPPPPHVPFPPLPPIYRTSVNASGESDTSDTTGAASPPTAEGAGAAPPQAAAAAAFEQISAGFRPPIVTASPEKRHRRDAEPSEAADEESTGKAASGFNLPHTLMGVFQPPLSHPPHPSHPSPHPSHLPNHSQPGPGRLSEPPHDKYVILGVASALTSRCNHGQMLFDDVIQELEFVQTVIHRDG